MTAKKKKTQWIQEAIKHPGSLTAQAKRRGMTVREFCELEHTDPTTRRRCALYKTLLSFVKKKQRGS